MHAHIILCLTVSQYVGTSLDIAGILNTYAYVWVCVYPQCAEATESLQHAVVYVLQSVGGQNQLIDPWSSFKRSLLYVSDTVITQVTT